MQTIRRFNGTVTSDLDRFISEQNIARYRKLLDVSTDAEQRLTIIQQLADEMVKLRTDA